MPPMKIAPESPADDAVTRRRGRPPGTRTISEPRATVSVWLPASAHDRLIKFARDHEQSISATVRQLLILRLP